MNMSPNKAVQNQLGFSMVELLVALVLGLILMASVGTVYLTSKESYRASEAISRVQENGRFSISKLSEDLRMAGFMGCGAGGLNISNTLNQNEVDPDTGEVTVDNGYDSDLHNFAVGIDGNDGASDTDPDTIRIKYANDYGLKIEKQMEQVSAVIMVTHNNKIQQYDIIMVCDVAQGDIFQVTGVTQGNNSARDTVVHNTGAGTPGNASWANLCSKGGVSGSGPGSSPHCLSKSYDLNARVFGMTAVEYSIGTGAGAGSPPALFRAENGGTPQEIAESVENMQVVYGVDTSSTEDGAADVYKNATDVESADEWERVVSARVSILVRTNEVNLAKTAQTYLYDHDGDGVETSQTAPDSRIRRVYTVTVGLRNRAG